MGLHRELHIHLHHANSVRFTSPRSTSSTPRSGHRLRTLRNCDPTSLKRWRQVPRSSRSSADTRCTSTTG
eukprot:15141148-Heterocapsa_arctica.AAC.1